MTFSFTMNQQRGDPWPDATVPLDRRVVARMAAHAVVGAAIAVKWRECEGNSWAHYEGQVQSTDGGVYVTWHIAKTAHRKRTFAFPLGEVQYSVIILGFINVYYGWCSRVGESPLEVAGGRLTRCGFFANVTAANLPDAPDSVMTHIVDRVDLDDSDDEDEEDVADAAAEDDGDDDGDDTPAPPANPEGLHVQVQALGRSQIEWRKEVEQSMTAIGSKFSAQTRRIDSLAESVDQRISGVHDQNVEALHIIKTLVRRVDAMEAHLEAIARAVAQLTSSAPSTISAGQRREQISNATRRLQDGAGIASPARGLTSLLNRAARAEPAEAPSTEIILNEPETWPVDEHNSNIMLDRVERTYVVDFKKKNTKVEELFRELKHAVEIRRSAHQESKEHVENPLDYASFNRAQEHVTNCFMKLRTVKLALERSKNVDDALDRLATAEVPDAALQAVIDAKDHKSPAKPKQKPAAKKATAAGASTPAAS